MLVRVESNTPIDEVLPAVHEALQSPDRPLILVLGGANDSGKLSIIEEFQSIFDRLLIGGALAYPFLQVKGMEIGRFILQSKELELAERILQGTPNRLILPTDHVVADRPELPATIVTTEGEIESSWFPMDIGPFTIESFSKTVVRAGTVIWSGPMGRFENPLFRKGTEAIARAIANSTALSLIGGDETVAVVEQMGLAGQMTHVSTGDVEFLEYLGTGILPALPIIEKCEYDTR